MQFDSNFITLWFELCFESEITLSLKELQQIFWFFTSLHTMQLWLRIRAHRQWLENPQMNMLIISCFGLEIKIKINSSFRLFQLYWKKTFMK